MIMKKAIIWVTVIVILGIGGFVIYKNVTNKTTGTTSKYAESQASVQNIEQSVSGSGSIQTTDTEALTAAGSDTVASVLVSKDQAVTAGQELVTFENGSAAITAPITGIISGVNVSAGDSVRKDEQLLTMFDNKHLSTTISVDETDVPSLKIGQKANITLNAFSSAKFTGTISDISQQGTYSNGVSNFSVTITIDNPQNAKVGMSTEAAIITASRKNVLTVPIEAVKDVKGEKYVIIPGTNGTTMQKVEVGITNGIVVEITNGLVAGQKVELPNTTASSNSSSSSNKGLSGIGSGTRNLRTSGQSSKQSK